MITTLAHSSITWDKPFYKYRILRPVAWVLERLISTPATHHAHHAATTDNGIGYYKGNFGNMFFCGTSFSERRTSCGNIHKPMESLTIITTNGTRSFYGRFLSPGSRVANSHPMVQW
jgi:hypothetical protein